jgi:hypothetical protein
MRQASQRAARAPARGGLPNAWFVVGAAEAPSGVLDGRVDELRVTLPWGSLMRGALDPGAWFGATAASWLRPGGELKMLLSVTPRDGLDAITALDGAALDDLAGRYRAAGWTELEARGATLDDVARSGSSWARRLGIPHRRAAVVLRLGVPPGPSDPGDPGYARSSAA